MNRIRELRIAAGLSRRELADAIGVTQGTVRRYETNDIRISLEQLTRIAAALQCDPADLVTSGLESMTSDVEPADAPVGLPDLSAVLQRKGLRLYRVLSDVMADTGIRMGSVITIDETDAAIEGRTAGDVLLVRVMQPPILLLRQYLPRALITTNKFGPDNSTLKLDDRSLRLTIVGVVLRASEGA